MNPNPNYEPANEAKNNQVTEPVNAPEDRRHQANQCGPATPEACDTGLAGEDHREIHSSSEAQAQRATGEQSRTLSGTPAPSGEK